MIKFTGYVLKPDGIEYADVFIIKYDTTNKRIETKDIIKTIIYISYDKDDLLYWLDNDFDVPISVKDRCDIIEDAQKQIVKAIFKE